MPEYKGAIRSNIPQKVIVYGVGPDGLEQPVEVDDFSLKSSVQSSTWSLTTTADNLAATVTKAAEVGKSHYITSISASYSAATIGLATVKDGATTIGNYHVHDQRDVVLARPLKASEGNAVEVSLSASGSAGVIGAVTVTGYTV